jgi:hypothetical protein
MNDDFELFDQSSDDPVDADIALITAYLARELSPVQIVAVEDRLVSDAAFRKKVSPILDAWVMPTALSAVHAGQGPLSRDEVEAGWARYVGEHAELDAHEGPRLVVDSAQRKRRKISMTRIAAGVAAITLPVLALAQVVVYVSKHPNVPGHSVAKDMVAPFVVEPPLATEPALAPHKPPPTPEDVRIGRQLDQAKTSVQRAAPVQVPAAESLKVLAAAPSTVKSASASPIDRERVIALVKQHLPQVVSGDTSASYAVVILDAGDNYVWSTHGLGSIQLVIGGDRRTPAERAAYSFKHISDYSGLKFDSVAFNARGGRGVGGVAPGIITLDSFRTTAVARGGGGRGGAVGDSTRYLITSRDSGRLAALRTVVDSFGRLLVRIDSLNAVGRAGSVSGGGARGGGGAIGGAVARGGGGGGRGAGVGGFAIAGMDSGSYVVGSGRARDSQIGLNSAAGLQEPGNGESGIQGLKASALTMVEPYEFGPGQLAPSRLRVYVVRLAAGTNWKGR